MGRKEKQINKFMNINVSKNLRYFEFEKLARILKLSKVEGKGSAEKYYLNGRLVLSIHRVHDKDSIGIGRATSIKNMLIKLGYKEV